MSLKPYHRKASKGSVQIKNSNDRLQLVFNFARKRHYLSLGFDDTLRNRMLAEMRAREIELDILSGNFDQTLQKYKPQSVLNAIAPDSSTKNVPTLMAIWTSYLEDKASSLKVTTRGYHASFTKLFDRIGNIPLLDSLKVKKALGDVTTVYQTKRALTQLNAACKWAKRHGLIDSMPYEGMAKEMPQYLYQLQPHPNAFTEQKREQVIEAFKNHKGNWNGRGYTGNSYTHYASFVEFLFFTGCRPSEAVGLQWKNVTEDYKVIRFTGSITMAENTPVRVDGSKNNKKRDVPCSERLQQLLQSTRPANPDPEALVFPSPKGKAINYKNFCNNAWNRVVDLIQPDTTPYSCRDTFITLQILKGIPESIIAKWCDTSVAMIQKYYIDFLKLQQFNLGCCYSHSYAS